MAATYEQQATYTITTNNVYNSRPRPIFRSMEIDMIKKWVDCAAIDIYSTEPENQLRGLITIREILAAEVKFINDIIKYVLDKISGVTFIHFIYQFQWPAHAREASWIISNITYGKSKYVTKFLENKEYTGHLIWSIDQMLKLKVSDFGENAARIVGNLAGDTNQEIKNLVKGFENTLEDAYFLHYNPDSSNAITSNIVWAMSNVVRAGLESDSEHCLDFLIQVVLQHKNNINEFREELKDALWGITYITNKDFPRVYITDSIVGDLIGLFKDSLLRPCAIRVIGNMYSCNSTPITRQTTEFLLNNFNELLELDQSDFDREILWTISNIVADEQYIGIIDPESELFEQLFEYLEIADGKILRELLYVFGNMTEHTKVYHQKLLQYNAIEIITDILRDVKNTEYIKVALYFLDNFDTLEGQNTTALFNILSVMKFYENKDISRLAAELYHKFDRFSQNEDTSDDSMPELESDTESDFVEQEPVHLTSVPPAPPVPVVSPELPRLPTPMPIPSFSLPQTLPVECDQHQHRVPQTLPPLPESEDESEDEHKHESEEGYELVNDIPQPELYKYNNGFYVTNHLFPDGTVGSKFYSYDEGIPINLMSLPIKLEFPFNLTQ